jgi:hypothetical protein
MLVDEDFHPPDPAAPQFDIEPAMAGLSLQPEPHNRKGRRRKQANKPSKNPQQQGPRQGSQTKPAKNPQQQRPRQGLQNKPAKNLQQQVPQKPPERRQQPQQPESSHQQESPRSKESVYGQQRPSVPLQRRQEFSERQDSQQENAQSGDQRTRRRHSPRRRKANHPHSPKKPVNTISDEERTRVLAELSGTLQQVFSSRRPSPAVLKSKLDFSFRPHVLIFFQTGSLFFNCYPPFYSHLSS